MPSLEDPLEGSKHEAYGDAEEYTSASKHVQSTQPTQPICSLAVQVDDLASLHFGSQLTDLGDVNASPSDALAQLEGTAFDGQKQQAQHGIENVEPDGKEECPVCKKKFVNVNIHIGRKHKEMVKQAKT